MNIFDAMGLADKERIHSQFLFWFFRLENNIVSDEVKHDFLTTFLDTNDCGFKDFCSYTEKSNIDIIITSDKMALVIENKLKSSQHSNQTSRYIDNFKELCKEYPKEFKRERTEYVLLSLIDERSESEEWKSITFYKLYDAFENVMPKLNKDIPEVIIINEYIKSIKMLIDTYDYFIKNYFNFPQVFVKDKESKIKEEKNNEYIKNLGLRIIYQKGFYAKIMETIDQSYKNNLFPYKNKKFPKWRVNEELRGEVLIQIIFEYYFDEKYFLGIQYQGSSFKINFQSSDYWKSNKKDDKFLFGVKAFERYKNMNTDSLKFNHPKKYAYISLSKKVDKFENSSFEEFCDRFKEEIILAIPIIKKIDSILRSK
jgi:hypothetical protein